MGAGGSCTGPLVKGMPAALMMEVEEELAGDVAVAEGPRPVECCFRAMMSLVAQVGPSCCRRQDEVSVVRRVISLSLSQAESTAARLR